MHVHAQPQERALMEVLLYNDILGHTVYENFLKISLYDPNISHLTYKKILANAILGNIDHRKMKLLSLDSSRRDEFNEPKFVKIQSLSRLKTGYVG